MIKHLFNTLIIILCVNMAFGQSKANFDYVSSVKSSGLILVSKNLKYGYVDSTFKIKIPLIYNKGEDFKNGYAIIRNEPEGVFLIDNKNNRYENSFFENAYFLNDQYLALKKNGQYGLFDIKNKKLKFPFEYDLIMNYHFRNNDYIKISKNGLIGIYDKNLIEKTSLIFDNVDFDYFGEYIFVTLKGKKGLLSSSFEIIIPIIYDYFMPLERGTDDFKYIIGINGLFGIIDRQNNIKISPKYEKLNFIIVDYGMGYNKNLKFEASFQGKVGILNQNEEWLVKPIYDDIESNLYKSGEFSAKKGDYWGVTNVLEDVIVPFKYSEPVTKLGEFYYKIKQGKFYGFTNLKGKEIAKPQYDEIYTFDNKGIAIIKLNSKHGLIDEKNNIIGSFKYDELSSNNPNGLYFAGILSKFGNMVYGYINSFGEEIIPVKYEELDSYFINGQVKVKLENGEYGHFNVFGELF